jgi:GrpB-like predicted nucleotidyltransferase (UPF0157 family)
MPPPIAVELAEYDSTWPPLAALHSGHLAALGDLLEVVHHIGSTAIKGILAKPIIDLLPVVTNLELLEQRRTVLERLGYQWHGEYGLPGRRYCLLEDAAGRRIVQAHFFEAGSFEITRHLAFRDYLRDHPIVAMEYEDEKCRAFALFPHDSHAYTAEKAAFIKRIEAQALHWVSSRTPQDGASLR